jgi:phosphohistidine phosphatase SixA
MLTRAVTASISKIKILCLITLVVNCVTGCAHTYYVVRHAEKAAPSADMASDPPLSDKGRARAEALREYLSSRSIGAVYTTNTIRARTTAQPVSSHFRLPLTTYGPLPDSSFITMLKSKRKNSLIVGHSNTVDDIVNGLAGGIKVPGDLSDNSYDNLFEIKYRRFFGKHITYAQTKYGDTTY